jgi:hypothetical protein
MLDNLAMLDIVAIGAFDIDRFTAVLMASAAIPMMIGAS